MIVIAICYFIDNPTRYNTVRWTRLTVAFTAAPLILNIELDGIKVNAHNFVIFLVLAIKVSRNVSMTHNQKYNMNILFSVKINMNRDLSIEGII